MTSPYLSTTPELSLLLWMNTGMQDAFNLGWKLGWIINNKLDDAAAHTLISSYHSERHPVDQKLLATTDQVFRMAAPGNTLVTTLRNMILPMVLPITQRSLAVKRRIFRFVTQHAGRHRPITDIKSAVAAKRYGVQTSAIFLIRPDAHILLRVSGDQTTTTRLADILMVHAWLAGV